MRRQTPIRLGDLWGDYLSKAPSVARKIAEAKASDHWAEAAGNHIAMYTTDVTVVRGVLTAKITSSSARNEAFSRRAQIKTRMNEILGGDIIRDIRLK